MVKVRNDLNDMVKSIKLDKVKNKYTERNVCRVTLFNNEAIEFKDSDGLYDLLVSYKKCGNRIEDLIKSRKLVEEEKSSSILAEDNVDEFKTYFCVLFELATGRTFRLFLARPYIDKLVIENYYDLFKKEQKDKLAQQKPQAVK